MFARPLPRAWPRRIMESGGGGLVGEMGENNEILSGKGLHWRFICESMMSAS